MNIHPDILIHWTDRRWADKDLTHHQRSLYLQRLADFYRYGLWLTEQSDAPEIIHGAFNTKTRIVPRRILCLTELRLSLVRNHIDRFGSLGIGFRRAFMMKKGANPVFYLQNDDTGVVNTNIGYLVTAARCNSSLKLFLSYVKAMSKDKGQDLQQYDEIEWRCVDCTVSGTDDRPYPIKNGHPTLEFQPEDVEIIIFPDKKTRTDAVRRPALKTYFDRHLPMMIDATEIRNL